MNSKRQSHSKFPGSYDSESDCNEKVRKSRKSRHRSFSDYSPSPKRTKIDKKLKKSKKHKTLKSRKSKRSHNTKSRSRSLSKRKKSNHFHDDSQTTKFNSYSSEFLDKIKKQSGIMSELQKINHPNTLLSEKQKQIQNKSENSNSSEKSTPTSSVTPVKTEKSDKITTESSPETKNTFDLFDNLNIKLEDINLPPEPEKRNKKILVEDKKSQELVGTKDPPPPPPVSSMSVSGESTVPETKHELEIAQDQGPSVNVVKVMSSNKEVIKPHQGSFGQQQTSKIIFENSDYCKLTTIPNNLPLPKIGNVSAYENHINHKSEKPKSYTKPILPLPNIPTKQQTNVTPRTTNCKSEIKCEKSVTSKNNPISSTDPIIKKPAICEKRSATRNNVTWGERSVSAFKFLDKVGEGTYGHVFKAEDIQTGELKALKKVRLENEKEGFPITAIREIKILMQLLHPNIVNLCEIVTDIDNALDFRKDKGAFYLVFDYMDHDLFGILESKSVITDEQVASIFKQLLEGIQYCHNKHFLHRDIKCSNILVNNKGEIKLADFGLARLYIADDKKRPYTNKVITLWYRPPELLLGEECYSPGIDIWSLGCILGELFTGQTMFTASEEMEQLEAISKVCGVPNTNDWPKVTRLPLYDSFKPRHNYKRRLREHYCTLPSKALDLLDWMLRMDPDKRCSASQALKCDWLRNIEPKKIKPPDFPRDRDCHELSSKKRRKLMRQEKELKAHKMGVDLSGEVKSSRNNLKSGLDSNKSSSIHDHNLSSSTSTTHVNASSSNKNKSSDDKATGNYYQKLISGDNNEVSEALSKLIPNAKDLIKNILDQIPKGTEFDSAKLHEALLPFVSQITNASTKYVSSSNSVTISCDENIIKKLDNDCLVTKKSSQSASSCMSFDYNHGENSLPPDEKCLIREPEIDQVILRNQWRPKNNSDIEAYSENV